MSWCLVKHRDKFNFVITYSWIFFISNQPIRNYKAKGLSYEVCKLRSSSLCSRHQSPATSSLLGSNIPLRTLFSITLNLCSSVNVRQSFTPIQNSK